MIEGVSHWLDVRDKPALLHRLMRELAGGAQISLEGDLSSCRFAEDVVACRDETVILKRNTSVPKVDFVVLRLTPETIRPIFEQVMKAGIRRAIVHVQIERGGVLELAACDNFHQDCVVTGPGVSPALLEELRKTNVLRDFKVAAPPQRCGTSRNNRHT
jgi:hypothetical protein